MASVVVTMESDVAKLIRDQQRAIRKQEELIAKLRDTTRAGRRTGKALEDTGKQASDAFGTRLTGRISTAITRVASFAAVLTGVSAAIASVRQEADKLGESVVSSEDALATLAQLASGDPERFRKLTRISRELFARGAAADLGGAASLAFQLESASALGEAGLFGRIGATRIADPVELAKAADALRTSLGVKETGTFADLISKAIGASGFSPSTAQAILTGAAKSGGAAGVLGISDEELLSAVSILAKATGEAGEGATQLSSLTGALLKQPELFRGSLAATVQELSKQSGAELFDVLGRKEAVSAVLTLNKNADKFNEAIRVTTEAQRTQAIERALAVSGADPRVATARAARVAEARAELAGEPTGILDRALDQIIAERITRIRTEGTGIGISAGLGGVVARSGAATLRTVLGDRRTLELLAQELPGGDATLGRSAAREAQIAREALLSAEQQKAIVSAAVKLEKAADKLNGRSFSTDSRAAANPPQE